ncbi:MAG: hypothetical protein PHI50_05560 [Alphaproteobacteria bacterium]|nr:hypothetical protein [Alphaproteobacteria bacterium]
MKENLIKFLKENKKKIITFILSGIVAVFGITLQEGALDSLTSLLNGLI